MTADDDTTQRIRELLEQYGYRIKDVQGWYGSEFDITHGGSYIVHPVFEDESVAVRWSLAHFLNDKAQTGARMKQLPRPVAEAMVRQPDFWRDVDESVAALWLRAYALPDPRKEVTP